MKLSVRISDGEKFINSPRVVWICLLHSPPTASGHLPYSVHLWLYRQLSHRGRYSQIYSVTDQTWATPPSRRAGIRRGIDAWNVLCDRMPGPRSRFPLPLRWLSWGDWRLSLTQPVKACERRWWRQGFWANKLYFWTGIELAKQVDRWNNMMWL